MPERTKTMCRMAAPDPVWWDREQCAALPYRTFEVASYSFIFSSSLPDQAADLLRGVRKGSTSSRTPSSSGSGRRTDGHEASMRSEFHQAALKHLDSLFGYALTLVHSPSEAEDLVQETYLRATRTYEKLAPDSHIKSWLFTILRNLFLNQARHRRAGPRLLDMEDEAGAPLPLADEEAVNPLDSYLIEEKQREVRRAIDSLPPSFREVIVLREFEELSYQQIADVLECPVGTVMSRLGRARDKLRQALQHWSKEKTA